MFNYITIAPDNTVIASRSEIDAPFKVLFKSNKRQFWDVIASAETELGAQLAWINMANRFRNRGEFEIVVAKAVSFNEWEIANETYMTRVRARMSA